MTFADRLLQEAAQTGRVPGVVAAVADATGVVYQAASGVQRIGDSAPVTVDSVFAIASMTKAITATAAMQLVEQGRLALDQPAGEIVEALRSPQVLEGFDAVGNPRLRPAKRPITLRLLLTHTAGFAYDTWNETLLRYARQTGLPPARSGRLAALEAPLMSDPGERWEYGIAIDWAGRMVEAVSGERLDDYIRNHIFAPLGLTDTGYALRQDQQARRAAVHTRKPDGRLEPLVSEPASASAPEFITGGGGLYSTAGDYLTFLRMLLSEGRLDGARVLAPETVGQMQRNHIGDLLVGPLQTAIPDLSNDVDFFPGMPKRWGLSFLINTEDAPTGRSAGSLAWAGLYNTYFWLDPKRKLAGVLLTQILPFGDPGALDLFANFERAAYERFAG